MDKTAINKRTILRYFRYAPKGISVIIPAQLQCTEWWNLLLTHLLNRFLDNSLIIKDIEIGKLFKQWIKYFIFL